MQRASAWSLTWQVLGTLVGAATLVSLVKNGFAIELNGLPAAIFAHYAWLRDALFEPVVWLLRYLGLTMPSWLKDLIMAYGLMAAVLWRVLNTFEGLVTQVAAEALPAERPWKSYFLLLSTFWPVAFHPVRHLPTGLVRAAWDHNIPANKFDVMFRRHVFLNLGLVLLAALAFFAWSHVSNVYGPG
jgi:hypothetical protein